jgi:hypothetical protein
MKGAFPPASKETLRDVKKNRYCMQKTAYFFIVEADILYSNFATFVLPVNVTFLTTLFSHISRPTSDTFLSVVIMFITPGGTPARFASYKNESVEKPCV